MAKFDPVAYDKEYAKKNYKHYHLKINKAEEEAIQKLEEQDNKNKYILDLIKKDLKRTQNGRRQTKKPSK